MSCIMSLGTFIVLSCLMYVAECEKADDCFHYSILDEADRKSSYVTPSFPRLCDNQLPEGWYRFVGAAGTKLPTTRVPAFRCGGDWSGWLDGTHPALEDGEVPRTVCFSDRGDSACKERKGIFVKNCGSHFIYNLLHPQTCNWRYCGTD